VPIEPRRDEFVKKGLSLEVDSDIIQRRRLIG
jgi:hypothetical protein